MASSLASIALATYNGASFLEKQLDSLLAQTYPSFEIVISDDGSTDTTPSIIQSYAFRDSRIRILPSIGRRGFIGNFERAIRASSGEVIFLCDQDDVWYPDKLKKHMEAYEDTSVMWAYNEVRIINRHGEKIGYLTETISSAYYEKRPILHHTWGSCILGCATSYRKDAVQNIWPADPLAPGHDSWIQLAIYPAKSFHINEILQDYRQHENNAVGLRKTTMPESEIIKENRKYVKSLVANDRLSFSKRFFFLTVFMAKSVRDWMRGK